MKRIFFYTLGCLIFSACSGTMEPIEVVNLKNEELPSQTRGEIFPDPFSWIFFDGQGKQAFPNEDPPHPAERKYYEVDPHPYSSGDGTSKLWVGDIGISGKFEINSEITFTLDYRGSLSEYTLEWMAQGGTIVTGQRSPTAKILFTTAGNKTVTLRITHNRTGYLAECYGQVTILPPKYMVPAERANVSLNSSITVRWTGPEYTGTANPWKVAQSLPFVPGISHEITSWSKTSCSINISYGTGNPGGFVPSTDFTVSYITSTEILKLITY